MADLALAALVWFLVYGVLWLSGLAFIGLGVAVLDEDSWPTALALIGIGLLIIVYRREIRAFFDLLAALVMEPVGL